MSFRKAHRNAVAAYKVASYVHSTILNPGPNKSRRPRPTWPAWFAVFVFLASLALAILGGIL